MENLIRKKSKDRIERIRKKVKRGKKMNRIVVCNKCGALYDLHYIDKVNYGKNSIKKFECKNCGMVDVVFSRQIRGEK